MIFLATIYTRRLESCHLHPIAYATTHASSHIQHVLPSANSDFEMCMLGPTIVHKFKLRLSDDVHDIVNGKPVNNHGSRINPDPKNI